MTQQRAAAITKFAIALPVTYHQYQIPVRESGFRRTSTDETSIIPPMLGRAAPLVIALVLITPEVQASPECMTKQEARAKWPTKPIYQAVK